MNSIIGISVRGKTYFFFNTFSPNQLLLLNELVANYWKSDSFFDKDDDIIIQQFILDCTILLNSSLQQVCIEEILVLK